MHLNSICGKASLVSVLMCGACGGGGGDTYTNPASTPTAPTGAGTAATITIRADGTLEPRELRIAIQDTVRFINQDTRPHQPQSNPHLVHTDCPAINRVGVLQPGESRTTDAFTTEKVCGFHDHMNPDSAGLGGVIRVAGAEGPPGPVYLRP